MNLILLTDGHPAPPLIEEPVEDSAPPPPPLPNSDFGKYQTSTLIFGFLRRTVVCVKAISQKCVVIKLNIIILKLSQLD